MFAKNFQRQILKISEQALNAKCTHNNRGARTEVNRQEAVSLLKELMTDCESFHNAQAVSMQHNRLKDSWEIHVSWVPHPLETECLKKIASKHSLEMETLDGKTVFRSL